MCCNALCAIEDVQRVFLSIEVASRYLSCAPPLGGSKEEKQTPPDDQQAAPDPPADPPAAQMAVLGIGSLASRCHLRFFGSTLMKSEGRRLRCTRCGHQFSQGAFQTGCYENAGRANLRTIISCE